MCGVWVQVSAVGVNEAHLMRHSVHHAMIGMTQYRNIVAAVKVLRALFIIDELFAAAHDHQGLDPSVR